MTKQDLQEYRDIVKELQAIDNDRVRYRAMMEKCTHAPDSSPGCGGAHDPYPKIVDKLDELALCFAERYTNLLTKRMSIEKAIQELGTRERRVIRARYIDGNRWEQIAVDMGYSWKQIHRIHKKALEQLKDDTQ